MTVAEIKEVYEKYKHLDKLLSDDKWLPDIFNGQIIYDLWQVVKYLNTEGGKDDGSVDN